MAESVFSCFRNDVEPDELELTELTQGFTEESGDNMSNISDGDVKFVGSSNKTAKYKINIVAVCLRFGDHLSPEEERLYSLSKRRLKSCQHFANVSRVYSTSLHQGARRERQHSRLCQITGNACLFFTPEDPNYVRFTMPDDRYIIFCDLSGLVLTCYNPKPQYAIVKAENSDGAHAIYELLHKKWKLPPPNLIVSVTGGAKNFKLKPQLTKAFRKSLMKVAETAGAWIITGGTNVGVMKHVGQAVHQHATVKSTNKTVTLGIATLGIIHKSEELQNNVDGVCPYDSEAVSEKFAALDHHHSHFVLVDSGKPKYGGEIEFRAKLEKHIAKKIQRKGEDGAIEQARICCVLVQGGQGSLKTVREALLEKTPVVVVSGSGQWSDILASLYTNPPSVINEAVIQELLMEQQIDDFTEGQLKKWTQWADDCMKNKKLLTVFQLDAVEGTRELDVAILQSLLQANEQEAGDGGQNKHQEAQLELAIQWDRCDIAESHILTDDHKIPDEVLVKQLLLALKEDRPAFVKLFLDQELDLEKHMNDKDVEGNEKGLYCAAYLPEYLNEIFESKCSQRDSKYFSNIEIRRVMRKLLGPSYDKSSTRSNSGDEEQLSGSGTTPGDRKRDLFQWAILSNKRDLARVLWNVMYDQLSAAIAAVGILTALSKCTAAQRKKQDLLEHAKEYENDAVNILTKCYEENPDVTQQLLVRKLDKWGGLTCLQIAVDSYSLKLVSHLSVQYLLDNIWMGGIALNTSTWRLVVAGVFPPLVFIDKLIKFNKVVADNKVRPLAGKGASVETDTNTPNQDETPTNLQKLQMFRRAPVFKFGYNVLAHLVFLVFFAYILVFNLYPFRTNGTESTLTSLEAPSPYEWFMFSWVIVHLIGEIYEMVNLENKSAWQRVEHWFSSNWNKMDLLALMLFFVGFGLRFLTSLVACRIVLSVCFVVYCVRILPIFAVSEKIGPKIIMVGNMIRDLGFFIFIVLVFMLAYGVTSQAMLYPNENRVWNALTGIIYKPYWQIYGELFLNEINYDTNDPESFSCTTNATEIANGGQRCPQVQEAVPIFSAVYMLLANILLLNLLIAMFSYTFDKLTENTDSIWQYQRYGLVLEYYLKPVLPPPLSIFHHLYRLYHYICGTSQGRNAFQKSYGSERNEKLSLFEHWNTDAYLTEARDNERDTIESRVQGIDERLDNLTGAIEVFTEHTARQKKISKRVKTLEAHMSKSVESLRWIIQAMNDNNTVPKHISEPVHVKALKSPYYKSGKTRFNVPEHLVSWTIPWAEYMPASYTASFVPGKPWADPTVENQQNPPILPYNKYDVKHKVDRSSHTGAYSIVGGLPRNPRGRTGLQGRGVLGRYGPNHAADLILTRWRKREDGTIEEKDGKQVLEFVAIQREDTGEWAIPGGMVDPGETVDQTLVREFHEEVIASSDQEALDKLFATGGIEIFRGYCDDERNTDNSWIETVARNFHDDSSNILHNVTFKPGEEAKKVKWKQVQESLKLFASHADYIKKIAARHNAYF